jgi:hypothetical protein
MSTEYVAEQNVFRLRSVVNERGVEMALSEKHRQAVTHSLMGMGLLTRPAFVRLLSLSLSLSLLSLLIQSL